MLRTEACRFTPRLRRADVSYGSARDAKVVADCTAYPSVSMHCLLYNQDACPLLALVLNVVPMHFEQFYQNLHRDAVEAKAVTREKGLAVPTYRLQIERFQRLQF